MISLLNMFEICIIVPGYKILFDMNMIKLKGIKAIRTIVESKRLKKRVSQRVN